MKTPSLIHTAIFVMAMAIFSELFFPLKIRADDSAATTIENLRKSVIPRLQAARPDLRFSDLEPSPVEGLYKIKVNGQTAFISRDGGHLIAGEMFEVQDSALVNLQEKERELTEIAFQPQRAKMLESVPRESLLTFSPEGAAKGHVYVFTDIDCGFCRRFHSQMPQFLAKGIEIRYLAFPRAGKDSDSAKKLATAWCAEDQQAMMTAFKDGKDIPLKPCENNPVAEQYMLGQQIGVNGTPAIVLESGKLIPGAVSPDYLAKEMEIE